MASKLEVLECKYNALRTNYRELESFYFKNFKLKLKGSIPDIINTEQYYIESTVYAKEQFDMLHRQFNAALANALDALETYRSSWFSNEGYVDTADSRIQAFTKNVDKIMYHLNKFDLILK